MFFRGVETTNQITWWPRLVHLLVYKHHPTSSIYHDISIINHRIHCHGIHLAMFTNGWIVSNPGSRESLFQPHGDSFKLIFLSFQMFSPSFGSSLHTMCSHSYVSLCSPIQIQLCHAMSICTLIVIHNVKQDKNIEETNL